MPQVYLGDSVYCEFDGYGFWLFLNNGERNIDGELRKKSAIYLEPSVLEALINFNKQVRGI